MNLIFSQIEQQAAHDMLDDAAGQTQGLSYQAVGPIGRDGGGRESFSADRFSMCQAPLAEKDSRPLCPKLVQNYLPNRGKLGRAEGKRGGSFALPYRPSAGHSGQPTTASLAAWKRASGNS